MNTIVGVVLRMLGAGNAIDALDGEPSKAYAAGVNKMIGGAVTVLGGVSGLLYKFINTRGAAKYIAIAQDSKVEFGAIALGWHMAWDGWADIGHRHALAKAVAENEPSVKP